MQDELFDSLCSDYQRLHPTIKDLCSPDVLEGVDLGVFFLYVNRACLTLLIRSGQTHGSESCGATARRTTFPSSVAIRCGFCQLFCHSHLPALSLTN